MFFSLIYAFLIENRQHFIFHIWNLCIINSIPVLSGSVACSLFRSNLNSRLPNCKTPDTVLRMAFEKKKIRFSWLSIQFGCQILQATYTKYHHCSCPLYAWLLLCFDILRLHRDLVWASMSSPHICRFSCLRARNQCVLWVLRHATTDRICGMCVRLLPGVLYAIFQVDLWIIRLSHVLLANVLLLTDLSNSHVSILAPAMKPDWSKFIRMNLPFCFENQIKSFA